MTRGREPHQGWSARAAATLTLLTVLASCSSPATEPASSAAGAAEDGDVLRIGVGPVLPTPEETRAAFTPFAEQLAIELGYDDYDLQEATEWAGIGVAIASEQVDIAWLGPWGYVLARDTNPAIEAVATVKYAGKPTYHALIVTRGGNAEATFPDDAEGASLTLADTGSTSGWLIPMHTMQEVWDIDPETYFSEFSEGGTHAANVIAVVEGNVDYASDFDRHLDAMLEEGKVAESDVAVVWKSDPLPNDAIAVRPGLHDATVDALSDWLVGLPRDEATALLPDPYDGFVAADDAGYAVIEEAGAALGRIDGD